MSFSNNDNWDRASIVHYDALPLKCREKKNAPPPPPPRELKGGIRMEEMWAGKYRVLHPSYLSPNAWILLSDPVNLSRVF